MSIDVLMVRLTNWVFCANSNCLIERSVKLVEVNI